MRNIILSAVLIFCSAAFCRAEPWSHVPDFEEHAPKTLLAKLIARAGSYNGATINYCLYYEKPSYKTEAEQKLYEISEEDLNAQIQAGLYQWTKGAAYLLKQHRQHYHFFDFIFFLERKMNFNRMRQEQCPPLSDYLNRKNILSGPDIAFIYSTTFAPVFLKREEKRNFYHGKTNPFILLQSGKNSFNNPAVKKAALDFTEQAAAGKTVHFALDLEKEESLRVILHELGHAFMHADDEYYKTKTRYAENEREFTQNIARRQSLPAATPLPAINSLMGVGGKITYDDLEAFIAAYDKITGNKKRKFATLSEFSSGFYNGGNYTPSVQDFRDVEAELRKFMQRSRY